MKKIFALVLILASLVPLSLGASADLADESYSKFSGQGVTLNVYNWGQYISDGTEDTYDTIKEFEALTGINVVYSTYPTNEDMYAKIKSGGAQYDVIIPSDYMIGRMIEEGMLEKINFDNVPNYANIDENCRNLPFDPHNEYSVPYSTGTVVLIYNKDKVTEPVDSWNILWDEKYSGEILMFDNSRDTFAISLKRLGYSFNTTDKAELDAAGAELLLQKPIVQAYVMDQIFDKMISGEAALAPYYSGDAINMIKENPSLAAVVPKEGSNFFIDAMCIPKGSKNKEAAELFINFMCEGEVALANAEFIEYSTPNTAAFALMDEEMQTNELGYPSAEVLERTEIFLNLPAETAQQLDALWRDIKTSGVNPWIFLIILVIILVVTVVIIFIKRRNAKTVKY